MPLQSEADMSKNNTQTTTQLSTNSSGSSQLSSEEEHTILSAALMYPELEKSGTEPSPLGTNNNTIKAFRGNLLGKRGRSSKGKTNTEQPEIADLSKDSPSVESGFFESVRRKLHEVSVKWRKFRYRRELS
jgi:hypothetical protein